MVKQHQKSQRLRSSLLGHKRECLKLTALPEKFSSYFELIVSLDSAVAVHPATMTRSKNHKV